MLIPSTDKFYVEPATQVRSTQKQCCFGSTCGFFGTKLNELKQKPERYVSDKISKKRYFEIFHGAISNYNTKMSICMEENPGRKHATGRNKNFCS